MPDDQEKLPRIKSITIDRNLCIGAASCAALAPKAFAIDSENKAVLKDTWREEDLEMLIAAAKSCPTNAIIIQDEEGNQIWPPKT